jgi:hypothetical protein
MHQNRRCTSGWTDNQTTPAVLQYPKGMIRERKGKKSLQDSSPQADSSGTNEKNRAFVEGLKVTLYFRDPSTDANFSEPIIVSQGQEINGRRRQEVEMPHHFA